MRLLAAPELQSMLYAPQEFISDRKLVEVFAGEVPFVVQLLQRQQRAAGAQPTIAAAVHALQALREKFDIANPSAIELHVRVVTMLARRAAARTIADTSQ